MLTTTTFTSPPRTDRYRNLALHRRCLGHALYPAAYILTDFLARSFPNCLTSGPRCFEEENQYPNACAGDDIRQASYLRRVDRVWQVLYPIFNLNSLNRPPLAKVFFELWKRSPNRGQHNRRVLKGNEHFLCGFPAPYPHYRHGGLPIGREIEMG